MVAILGNGRHFENLRGTRYFLNTGPNRDTHANVGACITVERLFQLSAPLLVLNVEAAHCPWLLESYLHAIYWQLLCF